MNSITITAPNGVVLTYFFNFVDICPHFKSENGSQLFPKISYELPKEMGSVHMMTGLGGIYTTFSHAEWSDIMTQLNLKLNTFEIL